MPKTEIDYSNTIIYKITCIDTSVNDLYVGHTTNFVQRKHAHKQGCTNEKSSNYNCKLYKTIRANGGWNNWIMEIVAFFKCNDHYEARIKEQEYFTSLNATLNSIEPLPKPKLKPTDTQIIEQVLNTKKYCCETCNVTLQNQHLLEVHNNTKKHCKKILGIETTDENVSGKYFCEVCNYKTVRKSSYNEHLLSRKHQKSMNGNQNLQKICNEFICQNCNKKYKDNSGLWRHKKKCNLNEENVNVLEKEHNNSNEIQELKEIMKYLMKENSEMKNIIKNIAKNIVVEK